MHHLHESAMRLDRENGVLIMFIVILGLWIFSHLRSGNKDSLV